MQIDNWFVWWKKKLCYELWQKSLFLWWSLALRNKISVPFIFCEAYSIENRFLLDFITFFSLILINCSSLISTNNLTELDGLFVCSDVRALHDLHALQTNTPTSKSIKTNYLFIHKHNGNYTGRTVWFYSIYEPIEE